jgi:ABC-type uncharacterized transport system substrate-binding protein
VNNVSAAGHARALADEGFAALERGEGGLCRGLARAYLERMHRLVRLIAPLMIALMGLLLASQAARAHPHIFVDAGLTLIMDAAGEVTAVEVTWRYDELYSMLLAEDYGLDPDFDLVLTEAEVAATLGFDLNWSDGFEGGLVIAQEGRDITLGAPEPVSLRMTGTGQIETTHRRAVTGTGAGTGAVVAQIYDPEFYVAFEMILPVDLSGADGCEVALVRADLDAAYAGLEAALEAIGGAVAAEDNFPPVGALFADRVEITCPA